MTDQAPTYECPDRLCIDRSGDRVICETCRRDGCDDCIAYDEQRRAYICDECLTVERLALPLPLAESREVTLTGGAPEDRRQSEDA